MSTKCDSMHIMSIAFKKIQSVTTAALFVLIAFLFAKLIWPYLFAILWAAIFAVIFYPLFLLIARAIRNTRVSSFLTVLIVILIVLLPVVGILGLAINQALETYSALNNPETITHIKEIITQLLQHPLTQRALGDVALDERLKSFTSILAGSGVQWLRVGSQSTATAILQLFIMLYALYYFLLEGKLWLKRLMHVLPFGDQYEKILFQKFISTAKATLKGTIFIGIIQGFMGGIFLAIAGVPSAAFLGMLMALFSILPAVGPSLVLVPTCIYLFITAQMWQAIFVIAGIAIISVTDNLLRPPLVGKDTQLHPMLILFGTLGGLALFGISGVVIGPIIMSLFMALLAMYEERYKHELNSSET